MWINGIRYIPPCTLRSAPMDGGRISSSTDSVRGFFFPFSSILLDDCETCSTISAYMTWTCVNLTLPIDRAVPVLPTVLSRHRPTYRKEDMDQDRFDHPRKGRRWAQNGAEREWQRGIFNMALGRTLDPAVHAARRGFASCIRYGSLPAFLSGRFRRLKWASPMSRTLHTDTVTVVLSQLQTAGVGWCA